MFAAVPVVEVRKHILEEMPEVMDEWGYVHGYYVDGYIVGSIDDVTDDYLFLEWWIPVIQETLLTEQEFAEAEEAWTEEMQEDLEAAQAEEEEEDEWDDYSDTYPCGCCTCCGCNCDWDYDDYDMEMDDWWETEEDE